MNRAGVRRVADVLLPEFRALGFDVHYAAMPDSLQRGGHLIAERTGTRGKKLLLIGHLDTVFEEDSPFQEFQRLDEKYGRRSWRGRHEERGCRHCACPQSAARRGRSRQFDHYRGADGR